MRPRVTWSSGAGIILMLLSVDAFPFPYFKAASPSSRASRDGTSRTLSSRLRRKKRKRDGQTPPDEAPPSSEPRNSRRPAFPPQTYPLSKDEAEIKHNFISFIDQSIATSYSQTVRLVEPRLYARPDQFRRENANELPTIADVAEPTSFYGSTATFLAWNGLPARLIVGAVSYLSFPFIVQILEAATSSIDDQDLVELVGTFLPGISIVLGTYFSLTISILYDRFTKMQEAINLEAGLLALTCNNLVNLYCDDEDAAVEGAQCIADQVRTMVFDSRGRETMGVIYSDPYARILQVLEKHDDYEHDTRTGPQKNSNKRIIAGQIHSAVQELFAIRSKRLNYEALALAPTHFDVMTFLCGMLLIGFALGTVATVQTDGVPVILARLLFASLVVCYTIFYEMSFDLNRPFDGIYQLRRSGAAMHFLHIKHLVCNHPLLAGHVDFEEVAVDGDDGGDGIQDCDGACKKEKARLWYN